MLHAYPKQARPMRVLRTQSKMQFARDRYSHRYSTIYGTAAKHTNVNVSYEKPYKGHKCIQNKINNDRDAMRRA